MKKLVRLINTRLIVHGCTSVFDIVINVDDCPAIIIKATKLLRNHIITFFIPNPHITIIIDEETTQP